MARRDSIWAQVRGNMLGQFGMRAFGLQSRAFELLGHDAAVLDLLFDAGDIGTDLVHLALDGIEVLGGGRVRLAAGLDLCFALALLGELLLDGEFRLAQCAGLRIQIGPRFAQGHAP